MNDRAQVFQATSASVSCCNSCQGLHLVMEGPGVQINAVLNADEWAEMFSQDPTFLFEVKQILARCEAAAVKPGASK